MHSAIINTNTQLTQVINTLNSYLRQHDILCHITEFTDAFMIQRQLLSLHDNADKNAIRDILGTRFCKHLYDYIDLMKNGKPLSTYFPQALIDELDGENNLMLLAKKEIINLEIKLKHARDNIQTLTYNIQKLKLQLKNKQRMLILIPQLKRRLHKLQHYSKQLIKQKHRLEIQNIHLQTKIKYLLQINLLFTILTLILLILLFNLQQKNKHHLPTKTK